jgi:hypothetical protein
MTVSWMLYALLVGTLLASAARLLEGMLRIAGRPARWVWAAALGLTIVLSALAPQRADRGALSTKLIVREGPGMTDVRDAGARPWTEAALAGLRSASLTVSASVERALVAVERSAGRSCSARPRSLCFCWFSSPLSTRASAASASAGPSQRYSEFASVSVLGLGRR